MYQENICPECGSRHHQDFVRCPTCHAFIIEDSPWQGAFNLLAIPLTLLFWWGLDALFRSVPLTMNIFSDVISRGILLFAIYGLVILFFKWRLTRRQSKAFRVIRKVCAESGDRLDDEVLVKARDEIDERNLGAYNAFIAFHRLRWLVSACRVDKGERQGMMESLRQHSESDWDSLETSFAFTQFLVWLLPSVGFLGTVWGMTEALQAFSGTVGSQSDLNFNAGLMETARGLGTAFHTTLVGLAAVIPVLAFATSCRRRSQSLLEKLDKYFLRLSSYMLFQAEHPAEAADQPAGIEPELASMPVALSGAEQATQDPEIPPVASGDPADELTTLMSDDLTSEEEELSLAEHTPEAVETEQQPPAKDESEEDENLEPWDRQKRDNISPEGLY